MMKTPKPKAHYADILLRCSKPEHENCAVMRNVLMENFTNVTKAYTTRTDLDTDYCVGATAIVKDGEINSFKKQLQNFKKDSRFKVSKVKIFVNKH